MGLMELQIEPGFRLKIRLYIIPESRFIVDHIIEGALVCDVASRVQLLFQQPKLEHYPQINLVLLDVLKSQPHGYSPLQFGFVPCRSAENALAAINQFIDRDMEEGEKTLVISLDIRRAFDTIHRYSSLKPYERLAALRNYYN
ncbi:hypothetical protein LAZ67_13002731 [Cordylochernes scorpioides]|uniref:Reverse transcriptase n=1 Tax=Cordylochernes scorpioides TaxID=51811 RepID=A0ABY6L565_9ARAC|nr:hypothetical protein LAZ67_13002731 [Cordylochernes scorpioides]